MSNPVSKLSVVLTGSGKQLSKELDKVANKADQTSMKLAGLGKGLVKAGAAATLALGSLGAILTGKFLMDAIRTLIDFESQMMRVKAITGQTTEESRNFAIELRAIAKQSRFTASETAQAAEVLALAGLTMEELGDRSEGAVKFLADFAEVAGGDIEMAAGIAVSAVSAFGMEMTELNVVGDVFTNTFTSSFVSLETLGQGMKFLAPTAHAANVSLQEAAAAVGALGNAGLQGTIAGTGLRMAINKLIAPTDDARRAMDRLGLDFMLLTPAGEQARATFRQLSTQIDSLKRDVEMTSSELKELSGVMFGLSIQEQKNQLAISRIRQRAKRENRNLTKDELSNIDRLEMANEGLSIQQQELSIQQQLLQRRNEAQTDSLGSLESAASEANATVNQQTEGITSLLDVVNQLNAAQATTNEILEIFSVRGGTAIMALQGQSEAFADLVQGNMDAEGATNDFLKVLEFDMGRQLAILRSEFEETKLVIAEAFFQGFTFQEFINGLSAISTSVGENKDKFRELGETIGTTLFPILEKIPGFMDSFMGTMDLLKPIIQLLGLVAKFFLLILAIVGEILKLAGKIGGAIGGAISSLNPFGSKKNQGKQDAFFTNVGSSAATGAAGGAMTGAAIGAMGGPIGAGGGALVGGGIGLLGAVASEVVPQLAEGGVVRKPTLAIVGEAGPEAVIPLDRFNGTGASSGTGTVINFGSITINGNMGAGELREIIRAEFPRIIKSSYGTGARGVV